jgi:phosphoribosylamine--glycine ligase
LACFGPRRVAAQLEGSKAFAKAFLVRHNIPTAEHAVFTELNPALAYVRKQGAPIVIKADGLAAGKGVVVALTLGDAEQALRDMLGAHSLGDASARVVIEEFLEGEEAIYIVISDGQHALPMATSQDHKRVGEADTGPNTGGMGAYSPAPVVTPEIDRRIMDEVIRPTLAGMAAEGAPFIGFLYAGLMIGRGGTPKVIEFNVRFGDPETQPIMLRLQSDLVELIEAALSGRLRGMPVHWDPRPAIGVVMAAHGYPGKVRSGDAIRGLELAHGPDAKVFHAGTREVEGRAVTAGGRVLTVCALGKDIAAARECTYATLATLGFDGGFHRRDIGHRALNRSS